MSIILSIISLGGILIFLNVYDQQPVPQYIAGVTLNAIISILTITSESSLLVAVAGAISQLKWRWYQRRSRSVLDLQLFDDASRGPLGSAMLLATRSWSLVSIGALVSILALAFGPFAQQLLLYPVRSAVAPNPPSNISWAQTYSIIDENQPTELTDTLNIVATALWTKTNESDYFAQTQCSTGNCIWDEFESLALCTQCEDRTTDVKLTDTSFYWPNDTSLADSTRWNISSTALTNFCHVHLEKTGGNGTEKLSVAQGTLCRLTPCVKKYVFSLENGTTSLNTTGNRYGTWFINMTKGAEPKLNGYSWEDGLRDNRRRRDLHNFARSSTSFTISAQSIIPLLNSMFQLAGSVNNAELYRGGNINGSNVNTTAVELVPEDYLRNTSQSFYLSSETDPSFQQIIRQGGLLTVIPRVAAQLSRYIRDKDNKPVQGKTYTSIAIVEVRWQWIIFPIFTGILGAVFVGLAMYVCRGDKALWKTSSLPLLYHGFEPHFMEDIIEGASDDLGQVSGMQRSAKNIYARLRRSSVDGQLRLAQTLEYENDGNQEDRDSRRSSDALAVSGDGRRNVMAL
ncbi:hypothetical protein F4679DRAFT_572456 [Xylaria curta]|nr:hypothetical protein F4679DRAFT_572456 [Xylaria curta]